MAKDETPALVEAISLDSLPKTGRSAGELSDSDKALAAAIGATAKGDTYANIVGVIASKDDAEKRAAQVKRLMRRAGIVPAGKAARARLLPVDGGFRIAAGFGEPGKAPVRKPKATADATASANGATPAAATA
jgi:hypothetical protein